MQSKGLRLAAVLAAFIFAVSCGKKDESGVNTGISSSGGETAENSGASSLRPTDIKVAKVVLKNVKDVYTVPGVAEAWEVVSVPTETSGPVTWIGKEEGDFVNAGDPILKINTENLTATLNSSKVQLESKRKDFIRTENLYKQSSVSQKSYEDAKDALDIAKVNYSLALEEYNKGVVKSPVKGVVDDVVPNKGEYVSPGTVAATIVTLDKMKIYVDIPEKDVPLLKLGQEADVYPADIGGGMDKIKGAINFISVTSNPKTLTYKARIDIDNQTLIKPGRIVRADIVRRDLENVILADIYAVTDRNGEKYVFVNEGGKASERKVKLGPMVDKEVVVEEGLKPGDLLIISGQQFLTDGSPVREAE